MDKKEEVKRLTWERIYSDDCSPSVLQLQPELKNLKLECHSYNN